MTKFESSVKVIPYSQERVYEKLADLSNLQAIKDRLPEDKVKNMSFDTDTLSFNVDPVGQLTLRIIEREPSKCIKFETTNRLYLLICGFSLWLYPKKNVN